VRARAGTDPELVTPIALPATNPPSYLWRELEPLELGDSTRAYVHLMRVEHRLRAAELTASIRRAELWIVAREQQLAAVERRAVRARPALRQAGMT
jgi:hypothetical protein